MKKKHSNLFGLFIIGIFLFSACQPSLWGVSSTPTPPVFPIFLSTATQPASTAAPIVDERPSLWADTAVPSSLRDNFLAQGFQLVSERGVADVVLEQSQASDSPPRILP